MGINKLEGTPWHIERFHRKEDDDRGGAIDEKEH